MKTYKFRLKKTNLKRLAEMARSVNFVWNFYNDTAAKYMTHQRQPKWLTSYELQKMATGCCKDLGLNYETLSSISDEYSTRRKQCKRLKLKWRSERRSLGWVPFKAEVKVIKDTVTYRKITFKFWKSRELPGKVRCGSFSQDAKGNWYVNLVCEAEKTPLVKSGGEVGIDLGLKTIATLSDGKTLNRENITAKYAAKLATAQRARKKKMVTAINAKIRNCRKDWNHKETTKIINTYDRVIVGNVSPSKLKKTRMAKSVSDAGWGDFKSMLAYKAIALGVEYKEVKENFSTVTCSVCFERTGPSGLSALGVREWTCKCGATHDRDVNAARNILRFGHESPIKGSRAARMCQ